MKTKRRTIYSQAEKRKMRQRLRKCNMKWEVGLLQRQNQG